MGFQDNSGEIFIDAVLTDEGRERISKNNRTFVIARWRPADDEIDYRFWNELTGSDSKDIKILDTPVFEASSNEGNALRYPLVTAKNARLQYLPTMNAAISTGGSAMNLKQQSDRTGVGAGQTVSVTQILPQGQSQILPDLVDVAYQVEVDYDLIMLSQRSPTSITPYGRARYIVQGNAVNSPSGNTCKFDVLCQPLTTETFDILVGVGAPSPRRINTTIIVTGQQSGLNTSIPVTIEEQS
jgi:hypothetical protein